MQYFNSSTPIGSLVLASLRMMQAAGEEERRPYLDILTSAGAHKPPRTVTIDSVVAAMGMAGGVVLDTGGGYNGTGPIVGDDSAGGLPVAQPPIVYAGARDGDLAYGVATARTMEGATAEGLKFVGEYHDLGPEPDEAELDGFGVWQPKAPLLPHDLTLLEIAAQLDEGVSSDIWYDAGDYGDEIGAQNIAETKVAMGRAAKVLRELVQPRPAKPDTVKALIDLARFTGCLGGEAGQRRGELADAVREALAAEGVDAVAAGDPAYRYVPTPAPCPVEGEGPAAFIIDTLQELPCVESAETFDGANSGCITLADGREFTIIVRTPEEDAAIVFAGSSISEAEKAAIAYLEEAPAAEPGEGDWSDLEAAYCCGGTAESFRAAEIMRGLLGERGRELPEGQPVCTYCGAMLANEQHADDCERPRWFVRMLVENLEVTASNEAQATRYAQADAVSCRSGWNYTFDSVQRENLPAREIDCEIEIEEVTDNGDGTFNCIATFEMVVEGETAEEAEANALARAKGEED